MTVLILCMTNFSLFVRNYRFHKNLRPSQVTALTNQPNRDLRRHKGYGGQESSSILLGRSVCFVFFPRNINDFLHFSTQKLKIRMEMCKPDFLLDVSCKA